MQPGQFEDWESLLRTIVAEPDDDLPRLVAADWLDEHALDFGQESQSWERRAELIRVQCELARLDPNQPRHGELKAIETWLLSPINMDHILWTMEACPQLFRITPVDAGTAFSGLILSGGVKCSFTRGFVEKLTCPAKVWLAHGHEILTRLPLRQIALTETHTLSSSELFELRALNRRVPKVEMTR
jgi:uncharacterized protein (TIGR02996 family)